MYIKLKCHKPKLQKTNIFTFSKGLRQTETCFVKDEWSDNSVYIEADMQTFTQVNVTLRVGVTGFREQMLSHIICL